jgi:hypothetical protein
LLDVGFVFHGLNNREDCYKYTFLSSSWCLCQFSFQPGSCPTAVAFGLVLDVLEGLSILAISGSPRAPISPLVSPCTLATLGWHQLHGHLPALSGRGRCVRQRPSSFEGHCYRRRFPPCSGLHRDRLDQCSIRVPVRRSTASGPKARGEKQKISRERRFTNRARLRRRQRRVSPTLSPATVPLRV